MEVPKYRVYRVFATAEGGVPVTVISADGVEAGVLCGNTIVVGEAILKPSDSGWCEEPRDTEE
jgi:hypothetical protein